MAALLLATFWSPISTRTLYALPNSVSFASLRRSGRWAKRTGATPRCPRPPIIKTRGSGELISLYRPSCPLTARRTSGVPGIIISRRGLVGYGPERRAQLNAPAGYPMASVAFSDVISPFTRLHGCFRNIPWNGQGSTGSRLGTWSPSTAPNQQG